MTIGQPVKALVESVLNGEWTIVSDTENSLFIHHDTCDLHLLFSKFLQGGSVSREHGGNGQSFLRIVDAEWMEADEKRWVEGSLNDWWAKKRKELDTERRAEARNKFMILVKETDEQT